jgi:hypothetical protein
VGVLYLALHHRIAVLRDVSVELEHRPLLVISSMDTLKKMLLETCWHFYSLTVRFGVRGVIALVVCHFQAARGGFGPRATRAMALGVVQNPPYIQDSSSCPHSNPKT